MSTVFTPVFCCKAAERPSQPNHKPHHDPNRELHESIFKSFISYALQSHDVFMAQRKSAENQQELLRMLQTAMVDPEPVTSQHFSLTPASLTPPVYSKSVPAPEPQISGLAAALQVPPKLPDPVPVLTPEDLANNPLTPDTWFVIHLTSRTDFGPVFSHRYFAYPPDCSNNWLEMTHQHWFAEGYPFSFLAEKWDLKCAKDNTFFRMTLRPNLQARGREPVFTSPCSTPVIQDMPRQTTDTAYQMPTAAPWPAESLSSSAPPATERPAQVDYMAGGGRQAVDWEGLMQSPMPKVQLSPQQWAPPAYSLVSGPEARNGEYGAPLPGRNAVPIIYSAPGGTNAETTPRWTPLPTSRSFQDMSPMAYSFSSGGAGFLETDRWAPLPSPAARFSKQSPRISDVTNEEAEFLERECEPPLMMPTPDTKQVSHLVTDEITESGLEVGAK